MVVMAPDTPRARSSTTASGCAMHAYTRLGRSWKKRHEQHSTNIFATFLGASRAVVGGMGGGGGATSAVDVVVGVGNETGRLDGVAEVPVGAVDMLPLAVVALAAGLMRPLGTTAGMENDVDAR